MTAHPIVVFPNLFPRKSSGNDFYNPRKKIPIKQRENVWRTEIGPLWSIVRQNFPRYECFLKDFFSQASPDRRCNLCSFMYNCWREASLSPQKLNSYVLMTWKLWLVGTTILKAVTCLPITQFHYSPTPLSTQAAQRACRWGILLSDYHY